ECHQLAAMTFSEISIATIKRQHQGQARRYAQAANHLLVYPELAIKLVVYGEALKLPRAHKVRCPARYGQARSYERLIERMCMGVVIKRFQLVWCGSAHRVLPRLLQPMALRVEGVES